VPSAKVVVFKVTLGWPLASNTWPPIGDPLSGWPGPNSMNWIVTLLGGSVPPRLWYEPLIVTVFLTTTALDDEASMLPDEPVTFMFK
jgi:hypothetical protein